MDDMDWGVFFQTIAVTVAAGFILTLFLPFESVYAVIAAAFATGKVCGRLTEWELREKRRREKDAGGQTPQQ